MREQNFKIVSVVVVLALALLVAVEAMWSVRTYRDMRASYEQQICIGCWAPLSTGLSRQEYWSGLPCFLSGDLPNPRIKPTSPAAPAFQVDALPLSHQRSQLY